MAPKITNRNQTIVTASLAALLGACGGNSAKPAPESPTAEPGPAAATTGPASPTTRATTGLDGIHDPNLLSMLPQDSTIYIAMDTASLRNSPSWARNESLVRGALAGNKEFQHIETLCGIDFVSRLGGFAIALNVEAEVGAVVVTGFSRGELRDCLGKVAASGKEGLQWDDSGNISTVTIDGKTKTFGWITDSAFLVGSHDGANQAWIEERLLRQGGLDTNSKFMPFIDAAKPASLWGAMLPVGPIAQAFSMLGGPPKGVYFTVNLVDGLNLEAVMVRDTPAEAAKLAQQLQGFLGMAGSDPTAALIAKGVTIDSAASDVNVRLALSPESLQELETKLQAAMTPPAPAPMPPKPAKTTQK